MIAASLYEGVMEGRPLATLQPMEISIVKSHVPSGQHDVFWTCNLIDEWTFMLLVSASLGYHFPDVVEESYKVGDDFTLADKELNRLVNLAVDLSTGKGTQETGMEFTKVLASVEARLKTTAYWREE